MSHLMVSMKARQTYILTKMAKSFIQFTYSSVFENRKYKIKCPLLCGILIYVFCKLYYFCLTKNNSGIHSITN